MEDARRTELQIRMQSKVRVDSFYAREAGNGTGRLCRVKFSLPDLAVAVDDVFICSQLL